MAGDTVYVVTATSRPPFFKSTLHALDRRSGDVIWEYDLEGWSATSVAVSGDAVFVTTTGFFLGSLWLLTAGCIRLIETLESYVGYSTT